MATKIAVNGKATAIPGSYSEVDASGLARTGLGATGIIAVIGQAEGGGEPGTVRTFNSAAAMSRAYRSGDLKEVVPFLWAPSRDDRVNGGAQQVLGIRVGAALQSAFTFDQGVTPSLTLTSQDYGLFTSRISVDIDSGTNQGKLYTITLDDTVETFDDVGGDTALTLEYTPGTYGASTMTVTVDATGAFAQFTKTAPGEADEYTGTLSGLASLSTHKSNPITVGNTIDVVSSSASDVGGTVTIYGIDNGTGNPATETLTLNGTSTVAGSTEWSSVHGVRLSAAQMGTITLTDNGDSDVLFALAPTVTVRGYHVLDLNVEKTTVALVSQSGETNKVLVIGLDEDGVAQLEEVTLNAATPVPTSGSWSAITAIATAFVGSLKTVSVTGLLYPGGTVVRVVSDEAADITQSVAIIGIDSAGNGQVEELELNGTTVVTGTVQWDFIFGVVLSAATAGTISLTATELAAGDVAVASFDGSAVLEVGTTLCQNLGRGKTTVSLAADASTSQRLAIYGRDTAGAAQVEILTLNGTSSVAGSDSWSQIDAICTFPVPAARTVTVSGYDARFLAASYDDMATALAEWNALTGWAVTAGRPDLSQIGPDDLDFQTATSALSTEVDLSADLYDTIAVLTASQLVTPTRPAGAPGAPDNTAAAVFLQGGSDTAPNFANWQAALNALRSKRVNSVVLLTGDAAVHSAGLDHCVYMAGTGKDERDLHVGPASVQTLAQAKAAAQVLNSRHTIYTPEAVRRFNTAGVLTQFAPYFTAALAAGMQAGAGVGVPLTHKFPSVVSVVRGTDYELPADGDDVIAAGLFVLETVDNLGVRVFRAVTTHRKDDNIAYVEKSVNQAVNETTKGLRRALEFAVGEPNFSGTANAVKGVARRFLDSVSANGLRWITAYEILSVSMTDDAITLDVNLAATLPTNFVLTRVHVTTADQIAA